MEMINADKVFLYFKIKNKNMFIVFYIKKLFKYYFDIISKYKV